MDLCLRKYAEVFTELHPGEPLQKLAEFISGARLHAHSEMWLYEGYQRYLLKNPLCHCVN